MGLHIGSVYEGLGVDANKRAVRQAFAGVVKNDFPGAFVNIIIDPLNKGLVFTLHSDGDGSKSLQRWLHALETGDYSVLREAVDDGIGMNSGDVAAAGFVFRLVFNSVVNVNAQNVDKQQLIMELAERFVSIKSLYERYGFEFIFAGGETADLPDQVLSSVFDVSVYATAGLGDVITGNVAPGDLIFGFRSDGQAVWEPKPNSGVMSNGVTLGRTCLMHSRYGGLYPYLVRPGGEYKGRFNVGDTPDELGGMTVSEAIMSPTRQWAILIKMLIQKLKFRGLFSNLHGISMNTGGGGFKVGHLGKGVRYCKTMPDPPGFFKLVQRESGETWENMFNAMNCGIGLDVVLEDCPEVREVLAEVTQESGVLHVELGKCEPSQTEGQNEVSLRTPFGDFFKVI